MLGLVFLCSFHPRYHPSLLICFKNLQVTWFPRHISELDLVANRTLDAGTHLESDHPGFHDLVYRQRRAFLTKSAKNHRWDKPIKTVTYTATEIETWGVVWDRMEELWDQYACREYLVSESFSGLFYAKLFMRYPTKHVCSTHLG